jgi:hypothetical protein
MEKWKFFTLPGLEHPHPLVIHPVASRYTDWAVIYLTSSSWRRYRIMAGLDSSLLPNSSSCWEHPSRGLRHSIRKRDYNIVSVMKIITQADRLYAWFRAKATHRHHTIQHALYNALVSREIFLWTAAHYVNNTHDVLDIRKSLNGSSHFPPCSLRPIVGQVKPLFVESLFTSQFFIHPRLGLSSGLFPSVFRKNCRHLIPPFVLHVLPV